MAASISPQALVVVLGIIAVVGVLWCESRKPWLEWLFKPLASLCFILLALLSGALDSVYGYWLLAGLLLCAAGDVFLISQHPNCFLAGLASFLVGHLFYAGAFLQLPLNLSVMLWGLLPVLLLAVLSLRWLWPHLPPAMQLPVLAYIGVICTMLLMAGSTWGSGPGSLVLIGAWSFAISDLSVARNQFIQRGASNRLWGIPLYYGAQMLLAWSPTSL